MVAVEADGGQHNEPGEHDWRDSFLAERGWLVLRFWNNEILANTDGIIAVIQEACQQRAAARPPPQPSPALRAGEGVQCPLSRAAGEGWGGCAAKSQLNFLVVNPPVGISSLKQRW